MIDGLDQQVRRRAGRPRVPRELQIRQFKVDLQVDMKRRLDERAAVMSENSGCYVGWQHIVRALISDYLDRTSVT